MIETIARSGICLNPVWSHAFQIARMAEKLPSFVRAKSAVPFTVAPEILAAYKRAQSVINFNNRRRSA